MKGPSIIELASTLPSDVIHVIISFIPIRKKEKQKWSPSLQKELNRIQSMTLKGKKAMYLRDLEDFCLN